MCIRDRRLRAELRRGMRNRDGVNGSLGADYVHRFGQFTFAFGPRLKFGNDTFMRNQFGVTVNDQMANPRYAAYQPKADLYAVGAYGSATYKQNEHWSYTVHAGYDRLRGDAARSPIIRSSSGSRDQWTIGAIISYTFGAVSYTHLDVYKRQARRRRRGSRERPPPLSPARRRRRVGRRTPPSAP